MIPALLALAVAACVFAPAAAGVGGDHIRGVTIITARRLGCQLRGDGLELGGVRLPLPLETQHIAVTGKSGAGKSNLIRGILRQIAARQEVGVVLDPDREYLSEFYRPERCDVVLNPLDERCPLWTPWLELRPGYAEPDDEAQAESLFTDPPRQADVGSTPFFRRSSRMLYLSLLNIAEPRAPAALFELLNLPRAELKQRLKGTPAEALIDPGAHEQGAGIVATVANAVNPFRYLPTDAATEWSAQEWAETRRAYCPLDDANCGRRTARQWDRDGLRPDGQSRFVRRLEFCDRAANRGFLPRHPRDLRASLRGPRVPVRPKSRLCRLRDMGAALQRLDRPDTGCTHQRDRATLTRMDPSDGLAQS
jgi:hypothetical protein